MQAVILAAGKGIRLGKLTDNLPKAMIPINGKPHLEIIVKQLKSAGITDILIIVHYLRKKIMDYFSDGKKFGVSIRYAEQKEMKGSADALLYAESFIQSNKFLCVSCDALFETDLLKRLLTHKSYGAIATKIVANPENHGVIMPEEKQGSKKIISIIEKPKNPKSNLVNASVYLLPKEIFGACKKIDPGARGEYVLTDAIQLLIASGKVFGYETSRQIMDVGTHENLAKARVTRTAN